MIRITKAKGKANCPVGEIDVWNYRVLDGDKILAEQSVDFNNANAWGDSIVKRSLATILLDDVEVEEITELEDKELVAKQKIHDLQKDFE